MNDKSSIKGINKRNFYAVVDYLNDDEVVYAGISEDKAAKAWTNGKCHGYGNSKEGAISSAKSIAARLRLRLSH